MNLKLTPADKSKHPIAGFIIRSANMHDWLIELNALPLRRQDFELFALPGDEANTVWGCFVWLINPINSNIRHRNQRMQQIGNQLFIPEYTDIFPRLNATEIDTLFSGNMHLMHPEIGLVELNEPFTFEQNITSASSTIPPQKPKTPYKIPTVLSTIKIAKVDISDHITELEKMTKPDSKKPPLSGKEKIKLSIYDFLIDLLGDKKKAGSTSRKTDEPPQKNDSDKQSDPFKRANHFFDKLGKIAQGIFKKSASRMSFDYNQLKERNMREMEKLMKMIESNPDLALKYAMPISDNHERSGLPSAWSMGGFSLFKLFGGSSSGNGGSILLGDKALEDLRTKYQKMARAYLEKGDYEKAAYVYIKLLKQYRDGAKAYESGKMFEKAASTYIKLLDDKHAAADCFKNASMYLNAIEIFEELENYEECGDLYMRIGQPTSATKYFERAIGKAAKTHNFLLAERLCKDKLHDFRRGQNYLLEAWNLLKDKSALSYLTKYFQEEKNEDQLMSTLKDIHQKLPNLSKTKQFIECLKKINVTSEENKSFIKETGIQLISTASRTDRMVVKQLNAFIGRDTELEKDVIRFTTRKTM
ncbi:MAG: hypothetical protein H6607_06350 [Flavobacteriales bacterium]|nr:hypothetical protein [Flavobacteriales bacterium]